MLKSILFTWVFLAVLGGGIRSGWAQDSFSKVAVTGTIYTEDGLGKLSARPLTNKLVMQLCGIVSNFDQYQVVTGETTQGIGAGSHLGIFVVNKSGAVQKFFVEYYSADGSDGTTGVEVGPSAAGEHVFLVHSILENTTVTGVVIGAAKSKPAPFQVIGGVVGVNSKFILKAKVAVTGVFKEPAPTGGTD